MLRRKLHRYIGIVMLAPLIVWSITGMIFFIKPGYETAYEILKLKTYPLEQEMVIPQNAHWQELRLVKSTLGSHLLVKTATGTLHLNPSTLEELPVPNTGQLNRLFSDAISQNTLRYGEIEKIEGNTAYTSTGVEVELDWAKLTFSQRGADSKLIDQLYRLHYLQWTPWPKLNQVLGVLGLLCLILLSVLGGRLYFLNRASR